MQGNLSDMTVANLIQNICMDQKTAKLLIKNGHAEVNLYFDGGNVVHASSNNAVGEEVVFQILEWENGTFDLETGVHPPAATIDRSWTGLLLEGARRHDENNQSTNHHKESNTMAAKKKSELLAESLSGLLASSSDIEGAAVVGNDGLVYSVNVPQKVLDENMVGAASAAVLSLSLRSVDQLKRGDYKQTLIQGSDGNIIVARLNSDTLCVGLTKKDINLGMAFAEMRTMTEELATII